MVEPGQVVDPNAPPPYSAYFTAPAYSEQKDLPPAYSNLGYDTVESTSQNAVDDASEETIANVYEEITNEMEGENCDNTDSASISVPEEPEVTNEMEGRHDDNDSPSASKNQFTCHRIVYGYLDVCKH